MFSEFKTKFINVNCSDRSEDMKGFLKYTFLPL